MARSGSLAARACHSQASRTNVGTTKTSANPDALVSAALPRSVPQQQAAAQAGAVFDQARPLPQRQRRERGCQRVVVDRGHDVHEHRVEGDQRRGQRADRRSAQHLPQCVAAGDRHCAKRHPDESHQHHDQHRAAPGEGFRLRRVDELVPIVGRIGAPQLGVWVGPDPLGVVAAIKGQRDQRHQRVIQRRLAALLGVVGQRPARLALLVQDALVQRLVLDRQPVALRQVLDHGIVAHFVGDL
jgi:hypothetical protein